MLSCVQPAQRADKNNEQVQEMYNTGSFAQIQTNKATPRNLFTITDAEKIMGEPVHLADSSTSSRADVTTYLCGYKANAEDPKSKKTGAIYFLFENYKVISSAQEKYASIKKANENHEGVKVLDDWGDEAYFHSDGENFYFIMVRKGTVVFNVKVNKITATTSLDEFNRVVKSIMDAL